MANIGFIQSDCCIVWCHLPDTRKPGIENRSVPTGSAYYLIIAFSVTLLSQLGGNKDHSTKICESCLTCMLVAVRSECEFVRKNQNNQNQNNLYSTHVVAVNKIFL